MSGHSYFRASIAQRGIGSPWDELIRTTAASRGLDPAIVKAIISAESAWIPTATDKLGSYGLMQINTKVYPVTIAQAEDPTFAIPYATDILLHQIQTRSSLDLAIAGYNAGTSRAEADLAARVAADVLGVGTYVTTVLDYFHWFEQNDVPLQAPSSACPPQLACPPACPPSACPPACPPSACPPTSPGLTTVELVGIGLAIAIGIALATR